MLLYNPFNSHLRGSLPGSSLPAVIFSVMAGGRDEMAVVPLSTGTPSAHKGAPLEKILDISAHIPPLLLSETWMIWLFDDSLFRKSVSAPYVSNMRRARYLDALPWALWKASAVLQPGGRIDLWTQTCIPHGAKAHWTGLKCTFKETLSQSFASCVLSLIIIILFICFFYRELTILLKATSAVFEYLGLSKPAKSSGIKPREASLSLFPLLSPGRTLLW